VTILLVTSVGGHLTELARLFHRLVGDDAERQWVTFDTPQSRSMLKAENVTYLDYTGPRDGRAIVRHSLVARRLFARGHGFSDVISAGSGIALSFLPLGQLRGASCHYIESFTRTAGPSATGRLLSYVPGITVYTQHASWSDSHWRYAGSIFDGFRPGPQLPVAPDIRRVVVTLGTMEDYAFRRLIDRTLAVLPSGVEVLWQVGCTDVSDLRIRAERQLGWEAMREAIEWADVVIAHAGCGSAITALEAGKMPLLVPRRKAHSENVDDHQVLLARELAARGLAVVREPDDLTFEDLRLAACSTIVTASQRPLRLRHEAAGSPLLDAVS
jgi:UDP-N-acetylglucosamine--N-acetylmuramyl-(pentapeptide) pyrophosphoryl-undecaprenol N-acetylglucosamine transferase